MNRQPFCTPPEWWSPSLSARWVRLWRPVRRRRIYREHGLIDIQVSGLEHVRDAMARDQGILITPNHPTHADPFVLLEAADQVGKPFYFMTAWQVFAMTHRLGRRVLRQHGCFSVNREGTDLRAFRQAVNILQNSSHPLVIFPEGEVFHLNDRVMHFRKGAGTAALQAARRGGRQVACVPCALKFEYVSDPTANLSQLMDRLERSLSWTPRSDMPLARRIRLFAEGAVGLKEIEYLGSTREGRLSDRLQALVRVILGRLEERYRVATIRATVPERVKQLRQRVIARLEGLPATDPQQEQLERDLNDLFVATQFFSYPIDYLTERPNIERMAETLDKLEEDVLGVRTATLRGTRRAIVSFGEPVIVEPFQHRQRMAARLTADLEERVQGLLDQMNGAEEALPSQPHALPMFDEAPTWMSLAATA